MKRGNKPQARRVSASRIARLRARYRGAIRRVKTLLLIIAEMTEIINTRLVVRLVGAVNQRVKLSKPEVDDYIVKRNDLRKQLVIARQECKDYKADYQEAINTNKIASKEQLGKIKKSIQAKSEKNILDEVNRILADAAGNGGKVKVMSLLEDAKSNMSEQEFKNHVKATTGVYIPKYVDLSKLRDVISKWEVSVPLEAVSE